jgi:exosortase N
MTVKKPSFTTVLLVGYALLIGITFRNFLRLDATFLLGVAILPTLLLAREEKSRNSALLLIVFTLISFLSTSYTLFYFSIIGSLLWFYSHQIGKISALPALLLLTISPIFNYFTDVFSFDLRLKITTLAVEILKKMDPSVSKPILSNFAPTFQAVGNIIRLPNGDEWQIDTACMGLNMLSVGLILTYFFIGFFAKKIGLLPTNRGVFVLVLAAFCFNLLSNLTRIIGVVSLKIPPKTVGHEVIGLLSFLIYGVVPMYFLIKYSTHFSIFFKDKIAENAFENGKNQVNSRKLIISTIVFMILTSRAIYLDFNKKSPGNLILPTAITADFEVKNLDNGVTQLRNDTTLIYLKNLPHSFTTEHSPMICWRGSGYEFQKIEHAQIGEIPVYIGILQRDTDQIHAVWWFESDNLATNDQIEWRFRAYTEGSYFRLVNVNAASRERALAASKRWLENRNASKLK